MLFCTQMPLSRLSVKIFFLEFFGSYFLSARPLKYFKTPSEVKNMSITNIGLLGIKSCVMIHLSKNWKPKINWTYLAQANCKKVSKVALFDKWPILDSFLTFALAREVQLNFGFQFLLSWIIAKLLIVNNPFFETNNFFTSEGASKIFKGLALRILEPKNS